MIVLKINPVLPLAILIFSVLNGCGGGGGSASQDVNDDLANDYPAFPVFLPSLQAGAFWVYGWNTTVFSGSSSGTSSNRGRGTFKLSLGPSEMVSGLEAFPIEVEGNPSDDSRGVRWDFTPRWSYVAIDNNKLMATEDGATWNTLFDADTGAWAGGGLFASFPDDTLIVASERAIENEYIAADAIGAGRADSQSLCETIAGVVVCGDEAYSFREYEFYHPQLGVIGYEKTNNSQFEGGGFSTIVNIDEQIGLIASSLRGDSYDLELESEPNNDPATNAMILQKGSRVLAAYSDEDHYGGTHLLINEVEPNDSPSTAQIDPRVPPYVLVATGSYDDPSFLVASGSVNSVAFANVTIEDFFRFEIPVGCTGRSGSTIVHLPVGDTAETYENIDRSSSNLIDLYIFRVDGDTATLVDSDFGLSPLGKVYRNSNQNDLRPGEYIVGVDIHQRNVEGLSYPITYRLDIRACIGNAFSSGVIEIADWYEIELPFTATLSVILEGTTDSFVLFEDSAATIIEYGQPSFDSSTFINDSSNLTRRLRAGTYQIGVFHAGDTDTEYELSVDYSP